MVDLAPHGAGASPGNRSGVICSGSQFSFKLPKIRLQTQIVLSLLNFLLIKVKIKRMPHINLHFSLTIHDRTQLQIFEFKFFFKIHLSQSFSHPPNQDPDQWLRVWFWERLRPHADPDPQHCPTLRNCSFFLV